MGGKGASAFLILDVIFIFPNSLADIAGNLWDSEIG